MQPSFLPLFLTALALFTQVALCFNVTVTATHNGQPIDPADIVLEQYTPTVLRLNHNLTSAKTPPARGHKNKNRADIRDTTHSLMKRNPISYSADWCGASSSSVTTNKITNVQGYFQVPTPTLRAGQGSPQYVGAWIGIDGATWTSALLQAGTASAVSSSFLSLC